MKANKNETGKTYDHVIPRSVSDSLIHDWGEISNETNGAIIF